MVSSCITDCWLARSAAPFWSPYRFPQAECQRAWASRHRMSALWYSLIQPALQIESPSPPRGKKGGRGKGKTKTGSKHQKGGKVVSYLVRILGLAQGGRPIKTTFMVQADVVVAVRERFDYLASPWPLEVPVRALISPLGGPESSLNTWSRGTMSSSFYTHVPLWLPGGPRTCGYGVPPAQVLVRMYPGQPKVVAARHKKRNPPPPAAPCAL